MNRYLPWVVLGGLPFALCGVGLLAQPPGPAPVKTASLPVTRVVLTNAGIGYFHREGTIDGTARVELKVSEDDVNDLILTLLVEDLKGESKSITYDNRAPAEITLKAFSIDLTENPTVGHLLNQVRGEKVTVTYDGKTTSTGSIVSLTTPKAEVPPPAHPDDDPKRPKPAPAPPSEQLVLLTDDRLETLPLAKITRVKFVKPELQAEFRKALEALAAARGEEKKTVGVLFRGNGQRKVSVGYIADAPLWKPTYRLTTADGKTTIELLAAIENTSDDDWDNVRVSLVSGRPITFKMDLYDPLFIPRPFVEPEVYASLRPPTFQGTTTGGQFGNQGGGGQFGQFGGGQFGGGQFGGGNFGQIGGGFGYRRPTYSHSYGGVTRESVRNMLRPQAGGSGGSKPAPPRGSSDVPSVHDSKNLGEAFEYAVTDPVTLPRFKSALVPVLRSPIESKKLSVFNPALHPTHPLKAFYLTNTTKQFLAQGPLTVYEDGSATGQARIADVKPNDNRLVAYALDLDVPVRKEDKAVERTPVSRKIVKGDLRTVARLKDVTKYEVSNNGKQPATVWVTHVIRPEWKLIAPAKIVEKTPDLYRFEVVVPPGEKATVEVIEEREETTYSLVNVHCVAWLSTGVNAP